MRALLLLALSFACAAVAAQPILHLETEDDPPHNMLREGKVVGSSTVKLQEAFKRAGIALTVELVPWARAYDYALRAHGYCVYSTARTTEREALFDWIGPIDSMDWVMYGRATSSNPPSSLADVKDSLIGGYNQDVITVWLQAHHYNVDPVTSDANNPQKLRMQRIDLWASSKPRATALLKGTAHDIVPLFTFGHTDLYLACHAGTPPDLIRALNAALDEMRRDGSFERIDAAYP